MLPTRERTAHELFVRVEVLHCPRLSIALQMDLPFPPGELRAAQCSVATP
jgi:hypothetical protein